MKSTKHTVKKLPAGVYHNTSGKNWNDDIIGDIDLIGPDDNRNWDMGVGKNPKVPRSPKPKPVKRKK